jgi:Mg-chelatase subunit ChlD
MKEINIVFLLDETGSMDSILNDTIGGFNTFLKQQKEMQDVRIKFSLILFNSAKIEKRYIDAHILDVAELSTQNYIPNNGTPLFDAIGKTINELADKKEVLFVILTDGEENSSNEYTPEAVKKMIGEQEKLGWQFLYLGVDMDKFDDAHNIGISKHFSVDSVNTRGAYVSLGKTVLNYVHTGEVDYKAPEDDKK